MAISDFEKFVQDYITRQNLVIQKLDDMKTSMSSHHQKCNIVKTTGTAMSGTGVALVVGSVLMSPVTGGSSMAIGAGGAVMSVTGGLSNIITDYVDYKSSAMIMQDLQTILREKGEFDRSLEKQLDNLQKIIDSFVKTGIDKDTAIVTAIKGIALGCIDLTEEPNSTIIDTLNKIMKLHHIEKVTLETLPIVGRTMHLSEKSFQFIYNVLGLTGKSAPHILQTLGRISSMVSIAFTVIDLALLIRDWSTEHPSIEVIQEVQKKLEQEKIILQDLLEVIETSRGGRDKVLIKVIKEIKIIEDEDDLLKDFEIVEEIVPSDEENDTTKEPVKDPKCDENKSDEEHQSERENKSAETELEHDAEKGIETEPQRSFPNLLVENNAPETEIEHKTEKAIETEPHRPFPKLLEFD